MSSFRKDTVDFNEKEVKEFIRENALKIQIKKINDIKIISSEEDNDAPKLLNDVSDIIQLDNGDLELYRPNTFFKRDINSTIEFLLCKLKLEEEGIINQEYKLFMDLNETLCSERIHEAYNTEIISDLFIQTYGQNKFDNYVLGPNTAQLKQFVSLVDQVINKSNLLNKGLAEVQVLSLYKEKIKINKTSNAENETIFGKIQFLINPIIKCFDLIYNSGLVPNEITDILGGLTINHIVLATPAESYLFGRIINFEDIGDINDRQDYELNMHTRNISDKLYGILKHEYKRNSINLPKGKFINDEMSCN